MPILSNPKHEAFSQALAMGASATDAYAQAGYKVSPKTAAEAGSRLSRNVKVDARVTELQTNAALKAEWTVADRLAMLHDIAIRSAQTDARVAIAAIAETNKMQGDYAPTKNELSSPDGTMTPAPTVIRIIGADDGSNNPAAAETRPGIQ